jgi:hypothetical protein
MLACQAMPCTADDRQRNVRDARGWLAPRKSQVTFGTWAYAGLSWRSGNERVCNLGFVVVRLTAAVVHRAVLENRKRTSKAPVEAAWHPLNCGKRCADTNWVCHSVRPAE